MRITVASVSAAAGGTCSRSNACRRSSRVIAVAPSALRSSAKRTADASPSQKIEASRLTLSNGITRIRATPLSDGVRLGSGSPPAPNHDAPSHRREERRAIAAVTATPSTHPGAMDSV